MKHIEDYKRIMTNKNSITDEALNGPGSSKNNSITTVLLIFPIDIWSCSIFFFKKHFKVFISKLDVGCWKESVVCCHEEEC